MGSEIYKLRATLMGHSMDVRGVAAGVTADGKEFVVSASRDKSAKIWIPSGNEDFGMYQSCEGHTNFVVCVCVTPPCEGHPNGLILTGGNDHTILAFEMGTHSPIYRLVSHKGTVCSIAVSSGNEMLIVSGSWDMTAKIWRGQDNIVTLVGHSQAVWAVATIPETSQILTGSADRDIRLWDKSDTVKTFQGHTDCVRGLALLEKSKFISCSNDAQIILWNLLTGDSIQTFYGHTNFIYSLAALPNDEGFVSVSEDKTLRIWKRSEEPQVIFLPALSVWSVAVMKNGDVVTGSSDGVVRIFTCSPDRFAPDVLQQQFAESVAQTQVATQLELGGMKISELPGPEALLSSGKSDGATKMVREGARVVCYAWSEQDRQWNKVGDVVGGSGATQSTSGRVLYEGVEYDYVFNVSLDDNTPSLKLPYNITEDPWFAAQKFLEKNDLNKEFLDQVAKFIVDNAKGVELGSTPIQYSDPFTGGNRYVPGSGSSVAGSAVSSVSSAAAPATLHDRVLEKLRAEGVKLWLVPYYNADAKVASDGDVIGLASRYSSELGSPIDEVVTSMFALQRKAVEKLNERELRKLTAGPSSRS